MPTVLHTADVHLGRAWSGLGPAAGRLAELHGECFERLCRLASERGCVALVLAGDLFERPDPPAKLVEHVKGSLRRLTSQGVAVIISPGTHDGASSARSVYRSGSLGGAKVFLSPKIGERFVAERDGAAVAFQGLSWDPQATPAEFLADYERGSDNVPEVLVLHGEVGGEAGRRAKDLPVSARRLCAAGADYVALGHRHGYCEYKTSGQLWGAYPGTPFGLSFKEPELGPRTANLVTLGGGQAPVIEKVSTTDVQWLRPKLEMDDIQSQEDLLTAARAGAGAERLAQIELSGAAGFSPDIDALQAELAAGFLHLEIEDSSLELGPGSLDTLAAEQSVRGIFARRMRKRLNAARSAASRAEVAAAVREGLRALAEES